MRAKILAAAAGMAMAAMAAGAAGKAGEAELRETAEGCWAEAMKTWCPKTGIVYGCDPAKAKAPAMAKNNLYHKEDVPGWGPPGIGDAPLICGTALSGLCDKWLATKDEATKEVAAKVARGVLNLAILHGYRGFVARGICSDGKTTISLSSRDQYTHWVHGLWRYATSGMAKPELVEEYRKQVAAVAEFMEERVTEENKWNFGVADKSRPDPRGICTMWGPEVWPHEAARLPMVYAAAYMATKDGRWLKAYERYIDEAIERTLKIKGMSERQIRGRMPCYSLFQANTSLEVILGHEREPGRVAKLKEAMGIFAEKAYERGLNADPKKPPYGMCWDGELALTRLMAPEIAKGDELAAFLEGAIRRTSPRHAGICRNAHVMAAYWRGVARGVK